MHSVDMFFFLVLYFHRGLASSGLLYMLLNLVSEMVSFMSLLFHCRRWRDNKLWVHCDLRILRLGVVLRRYEAYRSPENKKNPEDCSLRKVVHRPLQLWYYLHFSSSCLLSIFRALMNWPSVLDEHFHWTLGLSDVLWLGSRMAKHHLIPQSTHTYTSQAIN